ncbi:MAG: AmmeMemoRadiSam system protein B, partial [candidate division NC10 bacterium]|nr:AmmeMemoRadiSam system protein B [candidate division NC10 bacterium]
RIEEIAQHLDDHLFLDNERFARHKEEVEKAFAASPVRASTMAGKGYEAEPDRLIEQLSSYFLSPEGPGRLPERREGRGPLPHPLRGAILPHIDFARGGPGYAWAYLEIAESCAADTFVILGTLHTEARGPFILTRKAFSTPLGEIECDQELIDLLDEESPYDLFAEEIAHRAEHSLELQMVFLRYICKDRPPVKVVPILCSSFHELIDRGESPLGDPQIASFLESLGKAISTRSERICLLASVDLAHMGPRFGDRDPLGEYDWRFLASQDQDLIQFMVRMDGEGFYGAIQREKNQRKICGVPAIYALLTTISASEGRLLKYGQWPDPQGTVSFASLAFYA